MQTHAGVFRDGDSLLEGCKKMQDVYDGMEDLKVVDFYMSHVFSFTQICQTVAQSVQHSTPDEVLGSIRCMAARSLLVGSVSV